MFLQLGCNCNQPAPGYIFVPWSDILIGFCFVYTRLFNESAEFYICWQIAVVVVYKQLLIRARYKNHEELSKANKTV